MSKVLPAGLIQRTDTKAKWTSVNPVLAYNERVFEMQPDGSRKEKVGDGLTRYNSLPFYPGLLPGNGIKPEDIDNSLQFVDGKLGVNFNEVPNKEEYAALFAAIPKFAGRFISLEELQAAFPQIADGSTATIEYDDIKQLALFRESEWIVFAGGSTPTPTPETGFPYSFPQTF